MSFEEQKLEVIKRLVKMVEKKVITEGQFLEMVKNLHQLKEGSV